MKNDAASPPSAAVNHYVLVVHGTWSAPMRGSVAWYQMEAGEDNFCANLSRLLSNGPLAGGVWRKMPASQDPQTFSWSGENTHAARIKAAEALADHIQALIKADPNARLHFVAHSHGGNVLLKALQIHLDRIEEKAVSEFFGENFATTNLSGDYSALRNFLVTRPRKVVKRLAEHFERTNTRPSPGEAAAIENFKQASRAKPQTWKARMKFWLQRPFTINQAQRKAAWQLIRDWITLPEHNNIGRMAFLGTPFFYKHWRPGLFEKLQNHKRAADVQGFMFILGAALLVASFYLQSVLVAAIAILSGGLAMATYLVAMGRFRFYRDVNVYFSPTYTFRESLIRVKEIESNPFYEGSLKSQFDLWKSEPRTQFEAMVLSGGHLDEALMGLTMEPLVRALAIPELERLTTPELWPTKPTLKVGMSSDQQTMKSILLLGSARQYVKATLLYPLNLFRYFILRAPTRKFLTNKLLLVVNSIGTGVAADEFERANIVVRKDLIDELGFFKITHLDVEKELASRPLVRESSASAAGDFNYLWDDRALTERLAQSYLWPRIEPHIPALQRAYRNTPQQDTVLETRTLQRMCVTLDERIKAVAGVLEVLHSSYYNHGEIVRDIARFLESGRCRTDG